MNILRSMIKAGTTVAPTRENAERLKEALVRLMRRAPLDRTEEIFSLRDKVDRALKMQNGLMMSQVSNNIKLLNASF